MNPTGQKQFIFLYSQSEIFRWELRYKDAQFIEEYRQTLNQSIDRRYRQKGFRINYALLDDCKIDKSIIKLQESDTLIKVGMNSKTHRTKTTDKTYPYPNQDFILEQLQPLSVLRVAGFHAFHCCERLAKTAHEKGIDSLINEELTQFLTFIFQNTEFNPDKFPSVNPLKRMDNELIKYFLGNRKNKPWLY